MDAGGGGAGWTGFPAQALSLEHESVADVLTPAGPTGIADTVNREGA
jgi:hypothetical protein